MKRMLHFSFLFLCAAIASNAIAAKPNIVFMLADDLGRADLGCYGADLHETPKGAGAGWRRSLRRRQRS